MEKNCKSHVKDGALKAVTTTGKDQQRRRWEWMDTVLLADKSSGFNYCPLHTSLFSHTLFYPSWGQHTACRIGVVSSQLVLEVWSCADKNTTKLLALKSFKQKMRHHWSLRIYPFYVLLKLATSYNKHSYKNTEKWWPYWEKNCLLSMNEKRCYVDVAC